MLREPPRSEWERVEPLFRDYPCLRGAVTAAFAEDFGTLIVPEAERPEAADLHLDFHILAGDPGSAAAAEVVRALSAPCMILVPHADWEFPLRRLRRPNLGSYRRVVFRPGAWDREELRDRAAGLPAGHRLFRVVGESVDRFAALDPAFTKNWPSTRAFLARGVGYAVEHEGRIVSGASSYTLGGGRVEIKVRTHPDRRRRGLALAASAALIGHCVDHDLEPCWDAANAESAFLAEKLGFVDPEPYEAFFLGRR